ncbi:MAG: hypothetical protein JXQ99_07450 [Hyphomicrobiaceae bacterium]
MQMKIDVQRLGDGPIIRPHMDRRMGDNVNGPSLIRVPEWLPNALGRYYLYFGHHDGHYIRLAVADDLTGPWRTHKAGVLPLDESLFAGHIASPDVIVDDEAKRIHLYYHGADVPTGEQAPQFTRVAVSEDGLQFSAQPEILGRPYMRVIRCQSWTYAIAMPGQFYRSRDGLTGFEEGPNPFAANMRHAALQILGDQLRVFYSRIGDAPERILLSTIDLATDWRDWQPTSPIEVLAPERAYEGGDLPLRPSVRGLAVEPVRELRDPAVFEENGEAYLLYSVAGESGIAIARLCVSP